MKWNGIITLNVAFSPNCVTWFACLLSSVRTTSYLECMFFNAQHYVQLGDARGNFCVDLCGVIHVQSFSRTHKYFHFNHEVTHENTSTERKLSEYALKTLKSFGNALFNCFIRNAGNESGFFSTLSAARQATFIVWASTFSTNAVTNYGNG